TSASSSVSAASLASSILDCASAWRASSSRTESGKAHPVELIACKAFTAATENDFEILTCCAVASETQASTKSKTACLNRRCITASVYTFEDGRGDSRVLVPLALMSDLS